MSFPNSGQTTASSAFRMPKIKKPLLLGKHGDKQQKTGLSLPSLKLPNVRQLLAGGLK